MVKNPEPTDVSKALRSVTYAPDEDSCLDLCEDDDSAFVQAILNENGLFTVEYTTGFAEPHYRSRKPLDLPTTERVLLLFLSRDPTWTRLFECGVFDAEERRKTLEAALGGGTLRSLMRLIGMS